MYAQDTILTLKSPKDPDDETGEAFPYNEVRVVGPSPIDHGAKANAKYVGADAAGVILIGLSNFGAVLDEPYGRLKVLYDVKSIPEKIVPAAVQVRVHDATTAEAGPTPEEVFAEKAPGPLPEINPETGERYPRGRTRLSPIESLDVDPRTTNHLGQSDPFVEKPNQRADKEAATSDSVKHVDPSKAE